MKNGYLLNAECDDQWEEYNVILVCFDERIKDVLTKMYALQNEMLNIYSLRVRVTNFALLTDAYADATVVSDTTGEEQISIDDWQKVKTNFATTDFWMVDEFSDNTDGKKHLAGCTRLGEMIAFSVILELSDRQVTVILIDDDGDEVWSSSSFSFSVFEEKVLAALQE